MYWEQKAKEDIERATRAEKERDEAKEEAHVARLAVVAVGDTKARVEVAWLRPRKPWQLRRRPSTGWRLKHPTKRLSECLSYSNSGRLKMKCLPSTLRRARTRCHGGRLLESP